MDSRTDSTLTPQQFADAFPFHLVVDRDGRVRQSGRGLGKAGIVFDEGAHVRDRFEIVRPAGFDFGDNCFEDTRGKLFVLQQRGGALMLRGEFVPCADGSAIALVTPWVRSARDLTELGLNWSDLPTHDPTRDLMITLQISESALESQTQLADDLRRRSEELRAARDEAERASAAKSAFLANMSHEIRTPLNGIIASIGLISSMPLDDEQSELIRVAETSAKHLLNLLNDLLDSAKIESGRLEIEEQPTNLHECLRNAACIVDSMAARHGVRLATSADGNGPDIVLTDAMRVQQVLVNLLSNAIKFSEGGNVSLHLQTSPDEAVWTITDDGIGMDADTLERVFEPFMQADDSKTRKYGGSGLGLTISRELARRMGGDIEIASRPRVGTTASLRMALRAAASPRAPSPGPADTAIRHGGLRVLLVEDNRINALVAKKILVKMGCDVSHVEDGEQAIASLEGQPFDVVLMDMRMPVMDGPTATRKWRERERQTGRNEIPIIAVTANTYDSDRNECMSSGMNDFLVKPIRPEALATALGRWSARDGSAV